MKWSIIADSSCDLGSKRIIEKDDIIELNFVPFIITIGGNDYIDDSHLDTNVLIQEMNANSEAAHTACPAPGTWIDSIDKDSNIFFVTISKELSGSYNSAIAAKSMLLEKQPDRNVAVINSLSAGPGLATIVDTICNEIQNQKSFDDVVAAATTTAEKQVTLFALSSFNNLVKNGRMNKLVGFIAGKLNFWGIGIATEIGTISIKKKVRGYNSALKALVDMIMEDSDHIHSIHISHCICYEMAAAIKKDIESRQSHITVEINKTKGLCSFYAEENGIMIAYV